MGKEIKVHNAEGGKRSFDEEIWNQLPTDKYGWVKDTETPEEMLNDDETGSQSGAGSNAPTEKTAAQLVELIKGAKTVDEVDTIVPDGETRVTVLNAADKQKELLSTKEGE